MTKILINTIIFQEQLDQGHSQYELLSRFTEKIDGFEVRGERFTDSTRETELASLQQLAIDRQIEFRFSIPECLFIDQEINPELENYFKLAKKFGICALKISLGEIDQPTIEQVTVLNHYIETYHVALNLENEPNQHGQLSHIMTVCQTLHQLNTKTGFTFDAGNWYWINESPEEAMTQLHQVTTVLHLKNITNQDTVLLADGQTDWRLLCRQIDSTVPIILEYPMTPTECRSELKILHRYLVTLSEV